MKLQELLEQASQAKCHYAESIVSQRSLRLWERRRRLDILTGSKRTWRLKASYPADGCFSKRDSHDESE